MGAVISTTEFKTLSLKGRGKVRDIYDLGDHLLIVATDRISAFDVVMPNPIPDKGRVLTQLSKFWFDLTKDIVPNHIISWTSKISLKHVGLTKTRSGIAPCWL